MAIEGLNLRFPSRQELRPDETIIIILETFEKISFQSRVLGIYVATSNLFVGVLNNHLSKLHNFSKVSYH